MAIAERDLIAVAAKPTWEERAKQIRQQFPSIDNLDWRKAFDNDVDLLARILRDILKADAAEPGRPGPRPALEYSRGIARMQQFMGRDYSLLPFAETFTLLAGGMSLTSVARKTRLERNRAYRLMKGVFAPTGPEIEQVAAAFKKHPSYFLEWRTAYVVAVVHERMMASPETTVGFYRRLTMDTGEAAGGAGRVE